ncbi:MAG: endonuclease [Firmicutes bacterium]|nr:endonuclease [Bacillota bacterium]
MNHTTKQKVPIRNIIIYIVSAILVFAGGLLIFVSTGEYLPDDIEPVAITGSGSSSPSIGDSLRIATWNVGYGALSADQDFIMDGGSKVEPESEAIVLDNLAGIQDFLTTNDLDIALLQEVDLHSERSYYNDETAVFAESFGGASTFAYNFNVYFVPFPVGLPSNMIGHVESGVQTLTNFQTEHAQRIALPSSYSWPVRTCQLKRCLLTQEIPLKDSDKNLVLVNLHLEAYAPDEAKEAQTRILMDLVREEYEKGNYVIAGGDFNQTFPGVDPEAYPVLNDDYFQAPIIDMELPQGFRFVFDDTAPTSRLLNEPYSGSWETTQLYVIDGFLVSPNVQIDCVETIRAEFQYSDHNPVILDVTLLDQ